MYYFKDKESKTEYLPQKCYNFKTQKNVLISECSSNCSSNTTDFKIQVIDGKKILICILMKTKELIKDPKHYEAVNLSFYEADLTNTLYKRESDDSLTTEVYFSAQPVPSLSTICHILRGQRASKLWHHL